ncbi:MAG: efflux RND transporter periplasmic adaptor subunit, partial [Bacteroidota bacterium]|nr:efflux RND transporter periplasmic adaptor subunit [Bacteroidota bacterium]
MNKIFYAFLSIMVFSIVSCHEKKETASVSTKFVLSDTMAKMISIDTVGTGFIHDELTLGGEISFNENNVHKIFPRTSGQIIHSTVSLGDKVRAGQVLAVVKSADVAGNYADLNSAKADIAIAKRELDNTESLYKNGIASEKEYTEAKE